MFLTRSIRRKMVSGLTAVLIMLLMLSGSGISGLLSYRNVVNDLDFSINQAPRRTDLIAAISPLFDPLLVNIEANPENAKLRQEEFSRRLALTKSELHQFRVKLEQMSQNPDVLAQQPVTSSLLNSLEQRISHLEYYLSQLKQHPFQQEIANDMLQEVAFIQTQAQQIPDPKAGLNATLTRARRIYRSRITMVTVFSIFVLLLFLGLSICSYKWIFAPIHKLHQGARRVAQGDFDYRIEITAHDEMAQLAHDFNRMSTRFQEIRDDLDRKVRERSNQLVRSERLADVGILAAGVAHEINNPLSAMVMAVGSLQERLVFTEERTFDQDDCEIAQEYLEMIQTEASRCKGITTKLLDFARAQDNVRSRHDLSSIVQEVISLIGHMSKYRNRSIHFSVEDPCYLEINGAEIKQVVLNLVANALESMDDGGVLKIDLMEQTDDVLLRFEDNGCGMTPEVIDKLFEPFFTQRKSGQGTGLGLSISHRIISDHGGIINASSKGPGMGSLFIVQLPRRPAQPDAA